MNSSAQAAKAPASPRASSAARRGAASRRARAKRSARRSYSAKQLLDWGLRDDAVAQAVALQQQGYKVEAAPHRDAAAYLTGAVDGDWVLLGVLADEIVFAVNDR